VAAVAIARRALRYWATDPRYLSSLLGAVVAPVLIVLLVATVVDAPAAVALSMGPLMAGTIGWGRHNDVAYDGSAFWMHVSAGVPGWADRLGRALAVLAWAVPVTVVVSIGGAAVAGRSDLAPAAVGASLGCLAAGLAVSAVFSPVMPYPAPEAGQNPYAAQMGAVGASMVAQLVTSVASGALALPVLALYGLALWSDPAWGAAVLAVGLVGGGGLLASGVVLGGRVYDRRSVRVLARLT
jgi:ABC-2 type transport system permease protein